MVFIMTKNIKSDFTRAFASPEFIISIFGIFLVLLMGCPANGVKGHTVVYLIWYSTYSAQFLLAMVLGTIPYAGAICEDMEYGYIYQLIIRGRLKSYCISKVIAVLASSVCSFVAGMMLFIIMLRFRCEWVDGVDSVYQAAVRSGSFRTVLQGGHFYLYAFLISVQIGMMIGILSLISVCISLYITNKLLIFSIPVMAYYFGTKYLSAFFPENIFFNLDYIYAGKKNVFNNDIISFAYAVSILLVLSACLTCLIYFRLRGRLNGK